MSKAGRVAGEYAVGRRRLKNLVHINTLPTWKQRHLATKVVICLDWLLPVDVINSVLNPFDAPQQKLLSSIILFYGLELDR